MTELTHTRFRTRLGGARSRVNFNEIVHFHQIVTRLLQRIVTSNKLILTPPQVRGLRGTGYEYRPSATLVSVCVCAPA